MSVDPFTLAGLCIAALVAGTVDAIAGGGGLVTLPALLVAGLPLDLAIGTNKGQSTFGVFAALAGYWRAGAVDRRRAPAGFALAFAGSLAGAALVLALPPTTLRPLVLGLLVAVAFVLAARRDLGVGTPAPRPAPALARAGAIALAIGAYDGFFGPGTGTFLIMAFVTWLGEPMARASANAKVVNFASNLAALALFARRGVVLWPLALPMALAQAAGGALGARLAVRRGDRFVRAIVLLVVVGLVTRLGWDLSRGR